MDGHVSGWIDPAFRAVREIFEASFTDGDNLGAAVTVIVGGRTVVDLWGGAADARTRRPWTKDTPCVTFSCTKAVTATAALKAAHHAGVELTAPVRTWWPEYAAAGKETTTLVDLLTHRAGLPAFYRPVTATEAADPATAAALLAAQPPLWQPGTRHGYHALTFGWLVGEFLRRHTDSTVGAYTRRHLGDQLWIGAPAPVIARAARIAFPPAEQQAWTDPGPIAPGTVAAMARAYRDPDSPAMRASTNPGGSYNTPDVLAAGWPATGLVTTARALARFYRDLIGGTLLPAPLLRAAIGEQVRGPDAVLLLDSAFGLGYMLACENFPLPRPARASAFGHPGAGGALGLGDLDHRLAFAFIPNLRRDWLAGDRRAYDLVDAVYAAL